MSINTRKSIISLELGIWGEKIICGEMGSNCNVRMVKTIIFVLKPIFSQRIIKGGSMIEKWRVTNTCI